MQFKNVALETMKGGVLGMLFEEELRKVLLNIDDPNTSAKAKRGITIKVTFAPNEQRGHAAVDFEVTSKLCPEQHGTVVYFHRDAEGLPVALENDPRQVTVEEVIEKAEEEGAKEPAEELPETDLESIEADPDIDDANVVNFP